MVEKSRASRRSSLSTMLMIRLSSDDLALLDSIQARVPVLSRAAVARELIRRGLRDVSEGDPAQLLSGTGEKKKRRGADP
jgi:hypothetical protein